MSSMFNRIICILCISIYLFSMTSCKKLESDLIGELKAENGSFQWYDLDWGESIDSTSDYIGCKLQSKPYITTNEDIDYQKDDYDFAVFYPKDEEECMVNLYNCVGKKSFGFSNNQLISVCLEFLASDNDISTLENDSNRILYRLRSLYGMENSKNGFEKGTDGKSSEVYYWDSQTSSTRLGLAINKLDDKIYSTILEIGINKK